MGVALLQGTSNLPSRSVELPLNVPFSKTVTPNSVLPLLSVTLPLATVCAKLAILLPKSSKIIGTIVFIDKDGFGKRFDIVHKNISKI